MRRPLPPRTCPAALSSRDYGTHLDSSPGLGSKGGGGTCVSGVILTTWCLVSCRCSVIRDLPAAPAPGKQHPAAASQPRRGTCLPRGGPALPGIPPHSGHVSLESRRPQKQGLQMHTLPRFPRVSPIPRDCLGKEWAPDTLMTSKLCTAQDAGGLLPKPQGNKSQMSGALPGDLLARARPQSGTEFK